MRDVDLFQAALGLNPPWIVTACQFDAEKRRLDITIDFTKGSLLPCSGCGKPDCPIHDTKRKVWRHLDFFQHEAYLHVRVPRTKCCDCGVKQVAVPWARPGAGFTLLLEARVMAMAPAMPVNTAAQLVNEHDTRLWRVIHHYVDEAREHADFSSVRHLAVDETATHRGHNYMTLFVDLDQRRVLYVADGKDAQTIQAFAADLEGHGGSAHNITEVCIDMSGAFIKGVAEHLPQAQVTFDKFHVVKLINEAVDQVRRAEVKRRPVLKTTRYIWLRNEPSLSAEQRQKLASLSRTNLETARAYRLRMAFQEVYDQPTHGWAELFFDRWYSWAVRSRLEPMKSVARTLRRYRDGILRWFHSDIANGLIEALNGLVQAAKAKARGYRTLRNLKAMTYLLAGKLDFAFTHTK